MKNPTSNLPALLSVLLALGGVQASLSSAATSARAAVVKKSAHQVKPTPKHLAAKPAASALAASIAAVPPVGDGLVLRTAPVLALEAVPAVPALPAQAVAPAALATAPHAAPAPAPGYTPRPNPYLANAAPQAVVAASAAPASAAPANGFGFSLPSLPSFAGLSEQSILPKIQTVHPTGEKPLVVVTFKCPTELIGIDTPSTLILHKVMNGSMELINKTDLLSFNLQQVCQ